MTETTRKDWVTGVQPTVNEAREFLEIAKDFKRPHEILREALSNSWDANATSVTITIDAVKAIIKGGGRRKQKINFVIQDNGDGMTEKEIHYFFNLGDSCKPEGSIGTKGHGTKIYYKSAGIGVVSHKGENTVYAQTEQPPWDSLQRGSIPTYRYQVIPNSNQERGTTIRVTEFDARHSEFGDFNEVISYLKWNTILGSVRRKIQDESRKMQVTIRLPEMASPATIDNYFDFPLENPDSSNISNVIKYFPLVKGRECGETSEGVKVKIDLLSVLLGDESRGFIPDTYSQSGLTLCKDYIMIERYNKPIEEITGGQYWYRSFLIFANCQEFDLTANRNEVREDEAYELALREIRRYVESVWNDEFTQGFFAKKREAEEKDRVSQALAEMDKRITKYKKRPNISDEIKISGIMAKVPQNEAETMLVLQALITARHKGIDFRIGEYNAQKGTDAIIEFEDKGIPREGWLELVYQLSNLFKWEHNIERIHKVACWKLGEIKPEYEADDGTIVKYEKVGKKHQLARDGDIVPVYVISEILGV